MKIRSGLGTIMTVIIKSGFNRNGGKAIGGDAWVDREGHNDTCHQHHRRRREGIKLERPKGMPFRGPLTSCFECWRHRRRDPSDGLPVVSMFNGTSVASDGILYL